MVPGMSECDVRVAELRLREMLAVAEAERRASGPARPRGAKRVAVGGRGRLGVALVALPLRLRGASATADALVRPGGQGAGA